MYVVKDCQIVLFVYAQPGGKKNEILGLHDGQLKVRLKAPPVNGKANAELIQFLSKLIGIPKKKIKILGGESSRNKKVQLIDIEINIIQPILDSLFCTN